MLLLKSSHIVARLTPDNTAHSGDNTLCLLGANWLRGGLLSKAAFTHRTVQQVADPYKPPMCCAGCRWRMWNFALIYVQYQCWHGHRRWCCRSVNMNYSSKVLPCRILLYKTRTQLDLPCTFSAHWGQSIVIDMVRSGQLNFADLFFILVKFNMSKRLWPDGHKYRRLLPWLFNKSQQLIINI